MNIFKRNLGLTAAGLLVALIFLLPASYLNFLPSFPIKNLIQEQNFHLGLDLKGGTHLDYRIDLRKAENYNSDEDPSNDVNIEELVEGVQATIEKRVNGLGVSEPNIYTSKAADEHHIIVELAGITDIEEAKAVVGKTIQLEFKEEKEGQMSDKELQAIKSQAKETLIKIKEGTNFDEVGEKIKSNDGKIIFETKERKLEELPETLKNLEIGLANEVKQISDGVIYSEGYPIENTGYSVVEVVKKTDEKVVYKEIFFSTVDSRWKETKLDGGNFKRANVVFNQVGAPIVSIEFDAEGGNLFGEITKRNIGKQVAIFVGGALVSAPVVNEAILGGSAQITGNFTLKEAAELKNDLNTGAIGAPIILSGQHSVDAMLGKESLERSVNAGLWGIMILILYMIWQYKFLGLIAGGALSIYAVFLLFILKSSGMLGMPIVLTLAGVAGIILSIGMAVDANILIFERMKEELRDGKNILAATSVGFDRAWSSIRDSNVSSLITCLILIWFGTSMIRGFAINLSIGILISMFTAITVTKSLLMVVLPKISEKKKLLGF